MDNDRDLYPITIIATRYQGVYEGGPWAALDCSFEEVPLEAIGSDVECAEFWALAHSGGYTVSDWRARAGAVDTQAGDAQRTLNVGAGASPDEAWVALRSRRAAR